MKDVTAACTKLDDNFSSKHIASLHFAEEAIQVSKNVVFEKSDANRLTVVGISFLCTACRCESRGWVVTELFVNVRGKGLSSARNKSSTVKPTSPLRVKWLIDIFFEHICETSNLSNATMCKVMEAYAPDYAITKNLLKKARTEWKISVFGVSLRKNVN